MPPRCGAHWRAGRCGCAAVLRSAAAPLHCPVRHCSTVAARVRWRITPAPRALCFKGVRLLVFLPSKGTKESRRAHLLKQAAALRKGWLLQSSARTVNPTGGAQKSVFDATRQFRLVGSAPQRVGGGLGHRRQQVRAGHPAGGRKIRLLRNSGCLLLPLPRPQAAGCPPRLWALLPAQGVRPAAAGRCCA